LIRIRRRKRLGKFGISRHMYQFVPDLWASYEGIQVVEEITTRRRDEVAPAHPGTC
jgi:hypothetical protein